MLPAVLAQRLGDIIYARMRFGYEDVEFGAPAPCVAPGDNTNCIIDGRGLHSVTSQLNLSASHGIGGAHSGCVAHV